MASEIVSRSRISPTMMTSGIFAQRAAQRRAERSRVRVHFALRDVAAFRLENVFDRVFERDDVLAPLDIHLLDQRRQRGRFSAADRAGHEDEPVLITREQFQMLGQPELVHRPHLGVDDAEDEIDSEPLAHDAGAKATEIIRVGEIGIAALVQLRFLHVGKKTFRQRERVFGGESRRIRPDRLQRSMQSPNRRRVHAEMNIRRARLAGRSTSTRRRALADAIRTLWDFAVMGASESLRAAVFS